MEGGSSDSSFNGPYFAVDVIDEETNLKYSTTMTSEEIEEISSDPEKYGRKLKELQNLEASSTSNAFKWTTNSIKLMVQERLDMEAQFISPKCKKVKLWDNIAAKMQQHRYNISGHDCNSKYRNLLQTYKQNKEKRSKKTGESKITWEFFQMFDAVLGTKPSVIPDKGLLSTSIEIEDSDEETEPVDDHKEEMRPIKKRKVCKELPVTQYLYCKEKRHEEDRAFAAKKWNETKELKKEEISAINSLAQAIMEATKSMKQ
jgi:hypothetical protein